MHSRACIYLECWRRNSELPVLSHATRLEIDPELAEALRSWVSLIDHVARAAYAVMTAMRGKFPERALSVDDVSDITEAAANCLLDGWAARDALTVTDLINGEWVPRGHGWDLALRGEDIQAIFADAAKRLPSAAQIRPPDRLVHWSRVHPWLPDIQFARFCIESRAARGAVKRFRSTTLFAAVGMMTLACAPLTSSYAQVHPANGASVHAESDATGNTPENNGGTQGGATGGTVGQGVANGDKGAQGANHPSKQRSGSPSGSGHDAGASTHSY